MTKPFSSCSEFDKLLSEAWDLSTNYQNVLLSRWLANLTYACPRPDCSLEKLKALVCTMRNCDQTVIAEVMKGCSVECAPTTKRCRRKELPKSQEKAARSKIETLADCSLLAALAKMKDCITMHQFIREVAVHTCDRGALLMRITKDVLFDFQSFIEGVFSNRVTQIAMVLGREQITIGNRYALLEARTMSRAQLALLHVRFIMPTFIWQRYVSESEYMKSIVACPCGTDEEMIIDEVTESKEDLRGKSLLYQLNWFRSEIERAESENRSLYDQHAQFTSELAIIEQNIAEIQCRAAKEIVCMTDELENLRARSADQVCTIDKLMDKVQMNMHKTKGKPVEAAR